MARRELSNSEIIALANSINEIEAASPALKYFFAPRIAQFRKVNHGMLRIINERVVAIQKQYVVYDDAGVPITETIDGVPHFTFHAAEDKEKYLAALNKLYHMTQFIEV